MLSNHEIYTLSQKMSPTDLLQKVHETQPGITMERMKGIIRACKKVTVVYPGAALEDVMSLADYKLHETEFLPGDRIFIDGKEIAVVASQPSLI